jgi:tetratricopeptide (TPR) repeat protein
MKKVLVIALLLVSRGFIFAASLSEELQWLAIQIACIGQYNNAQAGSYTLNDPYDYYKPSDIREYLTAMSGDATKTNTFYGICFDYAQAAYDDISTYRSHYESLGMQRNQWYIAAVKDNSRQIILYDPVSREKATERMNGVYLKENSRKNVRSHGDATWHAWLWVFANDGTIYWIDPTWTDNAGYVWWGIVQNGREVQMRPLDNLCMVAVDPNDAAFTYTNSGNANKNMGNWDQAIIDYTAVLRINPNNAAAYTNRGWAYLEKRMYDQAIEDLNVALRLDPSIAAAYSNRGWAYLEKGMYDRAIGDLNTALRLNPSMAAAYSNRGWAYTEKRMYDQAIEDLNVALRLDPSIAAAYSNRGWAYTEKGMYDQAIEDLNVALRLNPNNASTYNNRGLAYLRKRDYSNAIMDFESALQIRPNFSIARDNLELARRRGR